jgi:DNA-binding CsgD family transcriptional regulator
MVAVQQHGDMRELFDGLVPLEVIDAYERLLATGGCAAAEAASVVGGTALVEGLTSRGMACVLPHNPVDPAWLRPVSADLALQGVLAGHQNQVAAHTELLLDGQRRLAEAQARYGIPLDGQFPEHLVAVISDRVQISELSAALANTARQDWMTLETLATEMPLTADFAVPPLPASRGMVRCRSIYPAAAMDDPVAREIIAACADAGEQTRLLPKVPMKFKLADHTTALLPLTPSGTAGALIVRAPVMIAGLRNYFELLWDRAIPLGTPLRSAGEANPLTDKETTVLGHMAQGLADEAIAHRMGISLSTVRRHITAIVGKLGVQSRFAAGAAAHRRGWIE